MNGINLIKYSNSTKSIWPTRNAGIITRQWVKNTRNNKKNEHKWSTNIGGDYDCSEQPLVEKRKTSGGKFQRGFCASSLGVANAIISFSFSYTHTCGRGAAPDGELPRAVVIVVILLIAPGDRNYLNNAPSTPTTCEPLTHDPWPLNNPRILLTHMHHRLHFVLWPGPRP